MNEVNFLVTNMLVFCAVIAICVLRWLRKRPKDSQWIVSYPISVQLLAVVGLFSVIMGVSMLAELTPGRVGKLYVVLLSVPAGVLVFMAAAEVFASELSYNESMLFRCTPWRQLISVPFDDVAYIEKSPLKHQYAIHSTDGKVIRVFKWTDRSEDILAYAEEALDARNETAQAVTSG
jgi:hypothetical protein